MVFSTISTLSYLIIPITLCYKTCINFTGQIDTGATNTTISSNAWNKLGKPKAKGFIKNWNAGGTIQKLPYYYLMIYFNNNFIDRIRVSKGEIGKYIDKNGKRKQLDVLIGMDILSQFDIVLDGNDNNEIKITMYYPSKSYLIE